MSLTDDDRQRYARHLLLPELGEAGQAALCTANVDSGDTRADTRARETATDYLARAGVCVGVVGGRPVALPNADQVQALAGSPLLREAAAQLWGAFAAVELIKAVAGAGTAADFPGDLCLDPEPTP